MPIALLPGRGVVEVAGEDRVAFLQGLVSNDVTQARPGTCVWAALLTPQGKWVADFFVFAAGDRFLLDCARDAAGTVAASLSRFRLRSKVALRDASAGFAVQAGWGGAAVPEGAVAAPDPRLPEAGWRALAPRPGPLGAEAGGGDADAGDAGAAEYDLHRLALGLPDAGDLEAGGSVLLEGGFDELSGVSWSKGCYMGQELTARTKYRGLLKRRLFPVAVQGALPAPGTPATRDGAEIGEMRSGRGALGLALLRIEAAEAGLPLACGGAVLTPRVPDWMRLPARAPA